MCSFYEALALGMPWSSADKLNIGMPALQQFLDQPVDKFTTNVGMQNSRHTKIGEQVVIEGCTHTSCVLALKWVGEIELGPMVHTMQDPVVCAVWEVPHVNQVNLVA